MLCIAFTGGGTGGHIYPGLAVVSAVKKICQEKGLAAPRIIWLGQGKALDRTIVENAGIEFFALPSGKLRRNFSLKNLADFFKVIAGFFAARKILKKEKPALLFSKGGFVSVPPCAAAASLGITVFTHESDFSPGLATRLNARFAAKGAGKIIVAYPETAERFAAKYRGHVAVWGNPVREAFRGGDAAKGKAFAGIPADACGKKILLVLGGSQGAVEVNGLVAEALPELEKNYFVVHQTGRGNAGCAPAELYRPFEFISGEMPDVLAASDAVAARSGAGTIWECAAAGKPMILIPLAGSGTRGDQIENAAFFERAGAAFVILEDKKNQLIEYARRLAEDGGLREKMAAASAAVGRADAVSAIARAVLETSGIIAENSGNGGNCGDH